MNSTSAVIILSPADQPEAFAAYLRGFAPVAATLPAHILAASERRLGRFADLARHVRETGRPLPLPAEQIVKLEDYGFAVDLSTGEVDAITEAAEDFAVPIDPGSPNNLA